MNIDVDALLRSMSDSRIEEIEKKLGMVKPSTPKEKKAAVRLERKCKYRYYTVKVKQSRSCLLCGTVHEEWHLADILGKDTPSALPRHINTTAIQCEMCEEVLLSMSHEDAVERAINLAKHINNRR